MVKHFCDHCRCEIGPFESFNSEVSAEDVPWLAAHVRKGEAIGVEVRFTVDGYLDGPPERRFDLCPNCSVRLLRDAFRTRTDCDEP